MSQILIQTFLNLKEYKNFDFFTEEYKNIILGLVFFVHLFWFNKQFHQNHVLKHHFLWPHKKWNEATQEITVNYELSKSFFSFIYCLGYMRSRNKEITQTKGIHLLLSFVTTFFWKKLKRLDFKSSHDSHYTRLKIHLVYVKYYKRLCCIINIR